MTDPDTDCRDRARSGVRIEALIARNAAVWIIKSEANDDAVAAARRLGDVRATSFKPFEHETKEGMLIRILHHVEEHEGPCSRPDFYEKVIVYLDVTDELPSLTLEQLEFHDICETEFGFEPSKLRSGRA
jgi:hypothetical protein